MGSILKRALRKAKYDRDKSPHNEEGDDEEEDDEEVSLPSLSLASDQHLITSMVPPSLSYPPLAYLT